jgi:drug/metabolite transporter (DMT)-like permease
MDAPRQTPIFALLLLLAAVIWGFAFVAQRAGMEHVGPFFFTGVRFALGTVTLLPLLIFERKRGATAGLQSLSAWDAVLGCSSAGLLLFFAVSLQQVGLVYTTAGKAGFITGLYVVIVPLLGLLRRQPAGATVWVGAVAAVAGLYLLSMTGALEIELGDALVLASAFGWAVHVHVVGWLARKVHPIVVAVSQFGICAILALTVALASETISLEGVLRAGVAIAYAGFLSVGVAYTLQVVGQRHVDPSRAGIILSLEAVFAVFGGWLILGETMTPRMLAGCGLMLAGMLLSQIRAGEPSAADRVP